MWWPIIHSMAEYFRKSPDFADTLITEGAKSAMPKYPSIEILRDGDEGDVEIASKGLSRIFVQSFVKYTDSDPAVGYAALYDLEQKVIQALKGWIIYSRDNNPGYAIKVSLVAISGDGEMLRPVCGSRMVLEVNWRKQ